jgi:hypothetical protein
MKKYIFFLFTFNFLFALEIIFPKNISIDNNLKSRFIQYWNFRGNLIFSKSYNFEMPYLKYLYTKTWYKNFFKNAPKIKKISIINIDCKNQICKINFNAKIRKIGYIYYSDKWIKIDNTWYHRFNDNPLPF